MKNKQLQSNKKCENNENILIQKNSTKKQPFLSENRNRGVYFR
jgi:hypothetical protein